MCKDIKISLLSILLINFIPHLGHCNTGLYLKDWYHDKENVAPSSNSSSSIAYSPTLLYVEPSVTLDLAFLCPEENIHYKNVRSIVINCSNGQILETDGWRVGTFLPFVKFKTNERTGLQIKASDCPITLTFCCLSTILSYKVMKKHLHSALTTIPLEDHKLWSDNHVTLTLTLWDLFSVVSGRPKISSLKIISSSPSFERVLCHFE